MDTFKISQYIRKVLSSYFQLKAKITGQRFYCCVLSGESGYNLVINSDMTVSCNCQDYVGTGHIGDLKKNDLIGIYNGPITSQFRAKLAKGILPIITCARCSELRWINKEDAPQFEARREVPEAIMVENTVHCNLRCVGCPRSVVQTRDSKIMQIGEIKKIAHLIKKHSIKHVCYHNLGEPFLRNTIYDELLTLKDYNPELKIGLSTNGTVLNTDKKRDAALLLDDITFSIDGPNKIIATKYQRKGNFDQAYQNLIDLVAYRDNKGLSSPKIEWKYVLFNWNDKKEMILKAIELAMQAKVDSISFWPTNSPIYGKSWRYYSRGYFKKIGVKNWKGRELNFK